MRIVRAAATLALSVAVASTLAGCLQVEWIAGRLDSANAAAELAHDLQQLEGVESAEAQFVPASLPAPQLTVHVTFASTADEGAWGAAATLIRAAAGADEFVEATTTARLDAGLQATVTVDPLTIEPDELVAEVAHWKVIAAQLGPVVDLVLNDPSYDRAYVVRDTAAMLIVADRWTDALGDDSAAGSTGWRGPGYQTYGVDPSEESLELLSSLDGVIALMADDGQSGSSAAAVLRTPFATQLEIFGGDPAVGDARAAITAGLESGIRPLAINWYDTERSASLWVGECVGTLVVNPSDRALLAQLKSPADTVAGHCEPAP